MQSNHTFSSIHLLRSGIILLSAISLLMACSDLRLDVQVQDGTLQQQGERKIVGEPEPYRVLDSSPNQLEANDQLTIEPELLSDVIQIEAGSGRTCALTSSGAIYCWGGTWYTDNASVPTQVSSLPSDVIDIAVGNYHACALTSSGSVLCWGHVQETTLSSSRTGIPAEVVPNLPSGIKAIEAGDGHTCVLTAQGRVQCWYDERFGEPMDGFVTGSPMPVDIAGLRDVTTIASGFDQMCALTNQGGVLCWGDNQAGQLGNGTFVGTNNAVQVEGLTSGVVTIAAGFRQTCALLDNNRMTCWGKDNARGPGEPTIVNSNIPADFTYFDGQIESITLGDRHGCALLDNGGVQCWGYNYNGEVGDGTMADRVTPVQVVGLTGGVSAIAAGGIHTCALMDDGHVKCWGGNHLGQLGRPHFERMPIPVDVIAGH